MPSSIRAFEFVRAYETDPRSDAKLIPIVLNRLNDIKYDFEDSDNSLREEVQRDAKESVLCH